MIKTVNAALPCLIAMRRVTTFSASLYAVCNLSLSAALVFLSVQDAHHRAIARATLHFVTSLALLPACASPSPATPPARRWPLLSAFVLCLTLLIEAFLRLLSAIQVVFYTLTPILFAHHLRIVLARLLASAVAILIFRTRASWHSDPKLRSPATPAYRALFLHALAASLAHSSDALGIIFVSSHLSAFLDAASALFTVSLTLPLFRYVVNVLIHATPNTLVNTLKVRREAVLALEGVLSCGKMHFWEESAGLIVGTLCIVVDGRVSKAWVLERAVREFEGVVDDLTVQVESWREGQEITDPT